MDAIEAGHNCWAFALAGAAGGGGGEQRTGDDGEPSGTAGRPILAAILGAGVDDAVVVVTRCDDRQREDRGR